MYLYMFKREAEEVEFPARICVSIRSEPEGMAPGAVLRQTSGAGRHAAPQRSLRGGPGHAEEPAAGGRLQTVGRVNKNAE